MHLYIKVIAFLFCFGKNLNYLKVLTSQNPHFFFYYSSKNLPNSMESPLLRKKIIIDPIILLKTTKLLKDN